MSDPKIPFDHKNSSSCSVIGSAFHLGPQPCSIDMILMTLSRVFFNLFELLVTHKFEFFILLFPNIEYSAQTCFLKSQMNFEINQFIPCHILKIYQDGTYVKTIVYAISVPLL